MSGTISMAAIRSEGWWQMLQRYKLFRDVSLKLNLAFQVVTALQAKLVYMSGTKPMAAIVSESWWQMLQCYKPF